MPLLAIDYCFLRDSADSEPIPCVVAVLAPFRVVVSFAVDAKGEEETAIKRLGQFLVRAGLHSFHYDMKSD